MKPVRKYCSGSRDNDGQTLPLTVMLLPIVILFMGLCIDLGFAYITKAQLCKGVDAAALTAMANFSQGTLTAQNVASSVFAANYNGNSAKSRDVGSVVPNFVWSIDASSNVTVDVSAHTVINTFLVRLLTPWKTMSVGATGQATRNRLALTLVLDRSGSMSTDGGAGAMPSSVTTFIDYFDDNADRAAMVSFSYAGSSPADVTMRRPFKTDIQVAVKALNFDGYTCSEGGLTNGLIENDTVTDSNIVKVIVFFTDGMANTWNYTFDCGNRNIAPDGSLYDSVTGASSGNGCTVPNTITGINGNSLDTSSCTAMHEEAEARAQRIGWLARASGNIIFSIGMGSPGVQGECGGAYPVLNPDFLKNLANTPDSETYDPSQPVGDYVIATDSGGLDQAFRLIATKILLRLSK